MSERRIEVKTADGVADGKLFLPDGDGPFPAVVFYMDAVGLRPSMTVAASPLYP